MFVALNDGITRQRQLPDSPKALLFIVPHPDLPNSAVKTRISGLP
jgi:hypothetical protein